VFDASLPGQDTDEIPTVGSQPDSQHDSFFGLVRRHRSPSISSDHGGGAAPEPIPVSSTRNYTQPSAVHWPFCE